MIRDGIRNIWDSLTRTRYDRMVVEAFRGTLLDDKGHLKPDSVTALAHLRRFCSVDESTLRYDSEGRVDPIATAVREGRREVMLEIQSRLTEEAVHELREANRILKRQLDNEMQQNQLDS